MKQLEKVRTVAGKYLKLGWFPIPIAHKSKKPDHIKRLYGGIKWSALRITEPEIAKYWFDDYTNIGLLTGESSNLFVLDIDTNPWKKDGEYIQPSPDANPERWAFEQKYGSTIWNPDAPDSCKGSSYHWWNALIEKHGTPDTTVVETGSGGQQWYFLFPANCNPNSRLRSSKTGVVHPAVDWKSNGGQVLAPPSIHPCGKPYTFLKTTRTIAEMPEWLIDVLENSPKWNDEFGKSIHSVGIDIADLDLDTLSPDKTTNKPEPGNVPAPANTYPTEILSDARKLLSKSFYPHHTRFESMKKIVGYFLHYGIRGQALFDVCQPYLARCEHVKEDPFDDKRLWGIIEGLEGEEDAKGLTYDIADDIAPFLDFVSQYKELPLSAFPKDLQRYIKEMAEHYMVPQGWFAGALLAVVSSLLGNKVLLPFGEWNVRPHFSFLIVCDKGTKKTHVIKVVMIFIFELDSAADNTYRQKCKDHRAKLERAKKEKDFIYTEDAPQRIHYFVSNITQEELAKIQNVYPQQIWYRDEFSGAISGCNQYKGGQGDDVQSCIERMDGTYSKCNRREWSADTQKPFLNALGTIQTDIVPQVFTGRLLEMGFADRFNFCLSPYIAPRVNPKKVPDEVKALLKSILTSLSTIPMRYVNPDHEVKHVNPLLFELTPEAEALAESLINETMAGFCYSTEDKTIRGLIAKSETTFMNLCLLLHCLHHAREIDKENYKDSLRSIDKDIVEKAFKLAMYFAYQNYNVLTLGTHSEGRAEEGDYRRLMAYMKKKKMKSITVTQASECVFQKKHNKTAEQVRTFLTSLAEQGKGSFDGTTYKVSV